MPVQTTVKISGSNANRLTAGDIREFVKLLDNYCVSDNEKIAISMGAHVQRDPYPDSLSVTVTSET